MTDIDLTKSRDMVESIFQKRSKTDDLKVRRSEMKDCDHDIATLVMELDLEWFNVENDKIVAREKGNPRICDSVAKKSTLVF